MTRVRAGLTTLAIALALTAAAEAGVIRGVRSYAGTHAQDLVSGIVDTDSTTGPHEAVANAVVSSPYGTVTATSAMAIPSCDGYTVTLSFACQRTWTAGVRPSVAFDSVGTTNAFEITVSATEDFTLETQWTAATSGNSFGLPSATLSDDHSFLAALFDPWSDGPNPSGSRTDRIAGRPGAHTFRIVLAGNAFASIPADSPSDDQLHGEIVLRFGFAPAPAKITRALVGSDSVQLTLEPGSYGQLNVIQVNSDLTSDNWTDLATVFSNGEPIKITLPIMPGMPAGFYRSRLVLP